MRQLFKIALKETASGRRMLIFTALTVTIAAFSFSLVTSAGESFRNILKEEGHKLMGADVMARKGAQFNDEDISVLKEKIPQLIKGPVLSEEFLTMLQLPDDQRLVQIRSTGRGWPMRGHLTTRPEKALAAMHNKPSVIIPEAIADEYKLATGDQLKIGELSVSIAGIYYTRPGGPMLSQGMAPTILISRKYVQQTGLITKGSRVRYRAYFTSSAAIDELREFKDNNATGLLDRNIRISTSEDAAGFLQRFSARSELFLLFLALSTLLLSLAGTAAALSVFLKQKKKNAAILRALGMTARNIFIVYAVLTLLPAVTGTVLGLTATAFFLPLLGTIGSEFMPMIPADSWQLTGNSAVLAASATIAGSLIFALWPLLRLVKEPPLPLLRDEAPSEKGLPLKQTLFIILSVTLFFTLILYFATGSFENSIGLTGSLAAAFALAGIFLPVLQWALRRKAGRIPALFMRMSLQNLTRLTRESRLITISAAFGIFLLGSILIAESSLQNEMQRFETVDAPNVFVMDVQPDQREKFTQILKKNNAEQITMVPLITVRIKTVNSEPFVKAREKTGGERQWEDNLRVREYFVTYRDSLHDGEKLVAGEFNDPDFEGNQVSIGEEWADRLDVEIGDVIELDIHGLPYRATVTSERKITWESMRPNSFLVLSPGEIENAPKQFVASFNGKEAENRRQIRRELLDEMPNLTFIDVAETAETVRALAETLSTGVRAVAMLSLVAGFLLLGLTLAAERTNREKDAALLKVLGLQKKRLQKYLVLSHVSLAMLTVVTGLLPALIIGWSVLLPVLKTGMTLPLSLVLLVILVPVIAAIQARKQAADLSEKSSLSALKAAE